MPVGLPNSWRQASASAEIGFHSAISLIPAGMPVIGTNRFDRKVSGNSQISPAVLAVSGFGMCRPTHEPTHDTV